MSVTVKVNGVANSLVHKGSNGISVATMPDVCKTPSPGGGAPVPTPYSNVSRSITLKGGTTSVKADHGKMIAVKRSEFSLSIGDNLGILGGVKSNTFMKESTWILYSFDVKMNGRNACRLTDKKFQNHQNTVDLGGEVQLSTGVTVFDLDIDCDEKKADPRPGKAWDDCMVEELCDMVNKFNNVPRDKIKRCSPSPSDRESPDYKDYRASLSNFSQNFTALVNADPPDEAKIKKSFGSDCRYNQWNQNGRNANPPRSGTGAMSPDHIFDVGLGGPFNDITEMKWVNSRVNVTCGGSMSNYDADKGLDVTCSKCCP